MLGSILDKELRMWRILALVEEYRSHLVKGVVGSSPSKSLRPSRSICPNSFGRAPKLVKELDSYPFEKAIKSI